MEISLTGRTEGIGNHTYVYGYIKPKNWSKMKKVYDACVAAKVEIPEKVVTFFNGGKPNDDGEKVYLREIGAAELRKGGVFEIIMKKVPKDVYLIRIFN